MVKHIFWLGLLVPLAACGSPTATRSPVARTGSVATPGRAPASAMAQLRTMTPAWRNATLSQAIDDAGLTCSKVTKSAYQQAYRGMAMWVATCPESGRWALFIDGRGYAQVRQCADVGQAGLPACAGSSG